MNNLKKMGGILSWWHLQVIQDQVRERKEREGRGEEGRKREEEDRRGDF